MVIVSEEVKVLGKNENVAKNREGIDTTYYNLRVGSMGFSMNIGVPKVVYDNVNEGDDIRLSGQCGFSKGSRFWFFDDLYLGD